MKKLSCIFLSLLTTVFLFANDPKGLFEVVNIDPKGIEKQFGALEYGKNYSIVFPDDFDFSEVAEDFFQYKMIERIHDLFANGSYLKFSGPFEYIFFDQHHSINNFSVIKTMIEDAPEKYFCIDISESYYEYNSDQEGYYGLPYNCFSDHPNLYWVYFGNFLKEDIPEGTCRNLKNLQAVFFHNEKILRKAAFENVNPKCLYINSSLTDENPILLSEYVDSKRALQQEEKRDYRNFKSAYEFDPYSGVQWLVDGDSDYTDGWWDDDYIDYDFYGYDDEDDDDDSNMPDYSQMSDSEDFTSFLIDMMYDSVANDLTWDDIGDWLEITISDAKKYIKDVDYTNAESVALAYISACQFYPEVKNIFISEDCADPFEFDMYNKEFTFEDYGTVNRIIQFVELYDDDDDDESIEKVFFVGLELPNGESVKKDLSIIVVKKADDNKWYVYQVGNCFLKMVIVDALLNS